MKTSNHQSTNHIHFSENVPGTDRNAHDGTAPRLDLSAGTLNRALRAVAHDELEIVRDRYDVHRDPVRCAVGVSLVLRSLAEDLYGESRIARFRGIGWLNFLLRTSNDTLLRPDFIETMSAALYGDPVDVELPRDCGFWFDAAASWIDHQCNQRPAIACAVPFETDV